MENQDPKTKTRQISFFGTGSKLFGIYIVNLLLIAITLGIYYPWAKAAVLNYLYQETELEGSRFMFHGTGKEMFMGFIKAVGIIAILYAILVASMLSGNETLKIAGFIFYFFALILVIPIAIHGAMKYRASRSSWRGIHFGYRGNRNELLTSCLVGAFLSIITFGIYLPWFTVKLRKYIIGNVRFGNIEFEYNGSGSELFILFLKGYFLTIITLGIYSFWFAKDLINYYIDNIAMVQDGRTTRLQSTVTGGGYFGLVIGNIFIILLSLGIAAPWATVRTLNFLFNNIIIEGDLDLDALSQTEQAYLDATGEDVTDMLDIGIV